MRDILNWAQTHADLVTGALFILGATIVSVAEAFARRRERG